MKLRHLTSVIVALLVAAGTMVAQRPDSSFVYGKLVEVTPTEIRYVDFLSSSSEVASTPLTPRTEAFGCSFGEVQPGVNFHMELEARNGILGASRVYFESCAPFLYFSGTVRARTENGLTLGAIQGIVGLSEEVAVVMSASTGVYNCEGLQVTADNIRVGDLVSVAVTDNNGTYNAVSLSINERCATYRSETMVFIELLEDGARFRQEDGNVVDLVFNNQRGNPFEPDSAMRGFVYTCTGELLRWTEIRSGQTLRVTYMDYAESEDVLIEAFLEEGCPQYTDGQVAAVTSESIDIREVDGEVRTYRIGPKTEIWSCRGVVLAASDVRVGANVKGSWLEEGSSRVLHYLQVVDGCSFSYSTTGVLTSVSDTAITLISADVISEIYLRVDNQSVAIDCDGMMQPVTSFLAGDTVSVFYRGDESGAYLDLLQSVNSCQALRVSGVIANVIGTNVLAVDGPNGLQNILVADDSQLFDCTGQTIAVTPDLIGKEIGAKLKARDTVPTISYAWITVNCVKNVISGRVISYENELLAMSTETGVDTIVVSDVVLVSDVSGALADRTGLVPGRVVCVFVEPTANVVYTALHIILDSDCGLASPSGIRVKGQVVSHKDGLLQLNADGKMVDVAVLGATSVQHQHRGIVDATTITVGTTAMVLTSGRLANGTPIAESVLLMDAATSVTEQDVNTAVSVFPNPAQDRVTVVGLSSVPSRIDVVDMMGRTILMSDSTAPSINCAALTPGAYVVRVVLANGSVTTAPLVINR